MSNFRTDLGITRALVGGNGNSFVEETEEAFHGDRLMVTPEAWLARKVEGGAHGREVVAKGGARVRNDEEAESNTKKNLFHEDGG